MVKRKTRIKIKDLPKNIKVSREDMRKVMGGFLERFPNVPVSSSKLSNIFKIETVPLPE
jgi:hypothetical protein